MRTPPFPHPPPLTSLTPSTPHAILTYFYCVQTGLDFAEDPFKDYRYEDPFNIEDPFKDAADIKDPFARSSSAVAFQTDDFFSSNTNGSFQKTVTEKRSGRVSAPPVAYDPFSSRSEFKPSAPAVSNDNDNWGWKDDWASDDAWSKPATQSKTNDAWANNSKSDWKTDNWANKTDNWATDWSGDQNKNLNETWPSSTLPMKKEKSPKPVKIAKSLVHTIGGIGRTKQKDKKKSKETRSSDVLASEEQQWAWAAAESAKLEAEAEERRRREDAELQLALAISRQEK